MQHHLAFHYFRMCPCSSEVVPCIASDRTCMPAEAPSRFCTSKFRPIRAAISHHVEHQSMHHRQLKTPTLAQHRRAIMSADASPKRERTGSDSAAKRGEVLFELPIGTKGQLICTRPKDKVYLITFSSPPDNRLTSVCLARTPQACLRSLADIFHGLSAKPSFSPSTSSRPATMLA